VPAYKNATPLWFPVMAVTPEPDHAQRYRHLSHCFPHTFRGIKRLHDLGDFCTNIEMMTAAKTNTGGATIWAGCIGLSWSNRPCFLRRTVVES